MNQETSPTAAAEEPTERGRRTRRGRRWLFWTAAVALLAVAVLVATPMIARQQLERWLLENGADEAVIQNIDFNPFYGTLKLEGLDVRVGGRTVISHSTLFLDVGLRRLLNKGLFVERAELHSVTLDVEERADGSWRVGSLVIPSNGDELDDEAAERAREELGWWLGLERLDLKDSRVTIETPRLKAAVDLEELSVERFDSRGNESSARASVRGRVNGAPLRLEVDLAKHTPALEVTGTIETSGLALADFSALAGDALERLTGTAELKGDFAAWYGDGVDDRLSYTGGMKLGALNVALPGLAATSDSIAWNGDVQAGLGGGKAWSVATDGGIALVGLSVELPDEALAAAAGRLDWSGKTGATGEEGGPRVEIQGRLEGGELSVSMADQGLAIGQQSLAATVDLKLDPGGDGLGLAGGGELALGGLSVEETAKELVLLAVDSLEAKGIEAASLQQAGVASVGLAGVALLRAQDGAPPSVAVASADLEGVEWSEASGLALGKLALGKLAGGLVRESDGSLDLQNALEGLAGDGGGGGSPGGGEPPASPAPALRIGELSVGDGSFLTFEDRTVDPVFKTRLDITSFNLGTIDSGKPAEPVPVQLEGTLNNYGTLKVGGSAKPFAEEPAVDLEVELRGQDMVNMSTYMIAATGYRIDAGLLDVDSRIVVDKGRIDANSSLFIKKLRLEEMDQAVSAENAGSIGMPLDKAFGMLTDKNGNVKLDVPIQGKLDELDIGLQSVINTVLAKATTVGMKTYLVYAFQPYGAAILLAEAVGNQVGKISLDPVVFDAGASALAAQQEDYLSKLGKVMQERPQIVVEVCAFTVTADLGEAPAGKEGALSEAQAARMADLGRAREEAVRDHMVSKYGVDGGRLVPCAPEHDGEADAEPRVVLTI